MAVEANLHGRMWNDGKPDLAPEWAHRVVLSLCPSRPPRLRFVAPEGFLQYGGRYFPDHHAIAVIDTGNYVKDHAVLVHECAHAYLTKRSRSHRGQHDGEFFSLVERFYFEQRVSPAIARMIEDNGYPDSWDRLNTWQQWTKGNR